MAAILNQSFNQSVNWCYVSLANYWEIVTQTKLRTTVLNITGMSLCERQNAEIKTILTYLIVKN